MTDIATKDRPANLPEQVKSALPDIFIKYQADLMATTAVNLVIFVEKSRRIGITWGVGADAVINAAAARNANGMSVFYMGYNLEMAREFINICADWAKIFDQACEEVEDMVFEDTDEHGDTKEIKAFRIRFASGFEIIALPSSPRSLRGMQGYVIIDEAAFHDNLEEVLKAAYALLMWGGKVLVVSTHDGVDNVFNQQIQAIKEKRKGFKKHKLVTITFQDAINDGLYERICLVKGEEPTEEGKQTFINDIYEFYGEGADEELDVIPRKSGGVYLPSALIEPCMVDVPVIRYELKDDFFKKPAHEKERLIQDWCEENLKPYLDNLNPKLVHGFGQDFARNGDLTIFAPICIEQNTRRKILFSVELRNIPFKQQEQIYFYITDRLPRFSSGMMDATGNGAQVAEAMQERYGEHRIHAVKINASWYEEALPTYKAAFQDQNIAIPKDADVLQDHRTAQVIAGIPQIPRSKGSDGKQRHGDSLIAFAGAYWATQQEITEYAYDSLSLKSPHINADKLSMASDTEDDYGIKLSRNFGNNGGAF